MASFKLKSLLAGLFGVVAVAGGAIFGNNKTRKKVEGAISDVKDKVENKAEEKK